MLNRTSGLKLVSIAAAALLASAVQAVPVQNLDLGVASKYSGFFFGDASKVMDVEGKFAVGGNLDTSGFSFGYRTSSDVDGPSLVVGGNVRLGTGQIFKGPGNNIDTNATVGPITSWTKPVGYGVYGGANDSSQPHDLRKGNVIDFGAAETQLKALSSTLATGTANGTVESKWGGLYLTGNNTADVQVFDVAGGQLGNLFLQNVKQGAQVLVNVHGNAVTFSGGQDGQLEALRGSVLFNLVDATSVNIATFTYGTILATKANVIGTGHIEGSIIGNSISAQVEIGHEPFRNISAVPEPETYALMLAGLGVVTFMARRRKMTGN
ncbi:choice-of-anchor A family protein [Roseateles oligotrophus]|uniref:Choice-of-anchor A family protein n=1 Tax=Roseateles oligotrophus TaxID=1769250 RepID=A0ABT2Y8Q9_9BURK|nr:choice-of-anchor A family protein [Roseateles oligotrophus]MCV2366681.1 choice-of-anchor A family protein [Roseateles oligotrophus]